jgi:hypothetical protein
MWPSAPHQITGNEHYHHQQSPRNLVAYHPPFAFQQFSNESVSVGLSGGSYVGERSWDQLCPQLNQDTLYRSDSNHSFQYSCPSGAASPLGRRVEARSVFHDLAPQNATMMSAEGVLEGQLDQLLYSACEAVQPGQWSSSSNLLQPYGNIHPFQQPSETERIHDVKQQHLNFDEVRRAKMIILV